MTPVRRYGSISVSFSVIYHSNNYCRGTGSTCNAVIQFNSLTLTMDVECRQKLMSISGFFVHHLWSPIPVWEGHRDFFCVPLCMVVREIMLMIIIDIYCRGLYDDMTVVVCI